MPAFPASISTAPAQLPAGPIGLIPVTYAAEDVMTDLMSDLMGELILLTPAPQQLPGPSPQ